MVGIRFERPVGPYADTKELEYISALHQTSEEIRKDGSIRGKNKKPGTVVQPTTIGSNRLTFQFVSF